jgi:hypothetical protein
MSKRLSVLLILGFLLGAAEAQKSDQSKKDLANMQGNWHAVAMEVNGMPSGEDAIKKFKLIVKKDDYSVEVNDGDTLRICLCLSSDDDSERPKDFKSAEDSNTALFRWQRDR